MRNSSARRSARITGMETARAAAPNRARSSPAETAIAAASASSSARAASAMSERAASSSGILSSACGWRSMACAKFRIDGVTPARGSMGSKQTEQPLAHGVPRLRIRGGVDGALERLRRLAAEALLLVEAGQRAQGLEEVWTQLNRPLVGGDGVEHLTLIMHRARQGEMGPRRERVFLDRLFQHGTRLGGLLLFEQIDALLVELVRLGRRCGRVRSAGEAFLDPAEQVREMERFLQIVAGSERLASVVPVAPPAIDRAHQEYGRAAPPRAALP